MLWGWGFFITPQQITEESTFHRFLPCRHRNTSLAVFPHCTHAVLVVSYPPPAPHPLLFCHTRVPLFKTRQEAFLIIIIQSQLIRIGQLVQLNSIRPLLFFLLFLHHQLSLSLFLHLLRQLYQWVTSPNTTAACLFVIATVAVISTEASDVLPATR